MSEDKKEPWLNYLALTTVVFAVCATLSTFKGGSYSTKTVISQAQASDQWAFFQAKSIRESLYRVQQENLALELSTLPASGNVEARKKYADALDAAGRNIAKYEKQKNDIQKDAKDIEAKRDDAQRHGQPFGIAVIFFQVAILLSSIAGLFKQKSIWYLALPVGSIGLFFFADGFLLFL